MQNPFALLKSLFAPAPAPAAQAPANRPVNYHGGGGYYSDGSKYIAGIIASGSSILFDAQTIRLNTRLLEFKSPHLRAIINRSVGTVIGRGLKARSQPRFKILGITPEEAEAWAEDVDSRYDMHCRDKRSVANGSNNFYQETKLIYRYRKRDGEYFVRFIYRKQPNGQSPLQVITLDPAQIDGEGFVDTYGIQYLAQDGIIRDEFGKETAYIVNIQQQDGTIKPERVPATGRRSNRTMMIHGFSPEYAGAGRGISPFAGTLQNFQDLNSYEQSSLTKAKAQNSEAFAIENDINAPGNPREGEATNFTAQVYGGDTTDPTNSVYLTAPDGSMFCPVPELSNQQPGSTMITNMGRGDKIRSIKSTAPADNYADYVGFASETNSGAENMPLSIAKMRFQDSFSAQKGETLLYWDTVVTPEIEEFVSDCPGPHREAWLSEEIAAGRIQAPGWSDPIKRQAWLSCRWLGVVMPDDISKTYKAKIELAKYNISSLEDEALNFNGSDVRTNAAKNARDFPEITPDPHESTEPEPIDEDTAREIVQDENNVNE